MKKNIFPKFNLFFQDIIRGNNTRIVQRAIETKLKEEQGLSPDPPLPKEKSSTPYPTVPKEHGL